MNYIKKNDFKELKNKTQHAIEIEDPFIVLDTLNIDYKITNSGTRYVFYSVNRIEKNASANIFIKNGLWKYKDFPDNYGNVVNIVMDKTGYDFCKATSLVTQILGTKDYVQDRLDEIKGQKRNSKTVVEIKILDEKLKKNIKKEHKVSSTITEIGKVEGYIPAIEYMKKRGIYKIPKQFKMITGNYINSIGKTKKVFGVGILTHNKVGADIHFLKKLGNLKAMSIGISDISFFKCENSNKVAIFESKMDYASAYQQISFFDVNIIIANSTSNHHKVVKKIVQENLGDIKFYNQNDRSGEIFIKNIIEGANIKKFMYINYENNELDKDINDLLLDNVKLESRHKIITAQEFNEYVY